MPPNNQNPQQQHRME